MRAVFYTVIEERGPDSRLVAFPGEANQVITRAPGTEWTGYVMRPRQILRANRVLDAIKLDLTVRECGGTAIFPLLPDPVAFRRYVDSFFPGCGSPFSPLGDPEVQVLCGGKLKGQRKATFFCPHCATEIAREADKSNAADGVPTCSSLP